MARNQHAVDLDRAFGLPGAKVKQCIHETLETSSSYAVRLMELDRAPLQQRDRLLEIVQQVRHLLEKHRG